MARHTAVLTVTLLCVSALSAPDAQAQEQSSVASHARVREALRLLEVWLDAQKDYQEIPGMSAAMVHDQELVWARGFGSADTEQGTPATPQTIYSICSISKLFTSIGVLQQRDAGRLRLADPVAQHLPWFTLRRNPPDGPEITIEGMLTHSAGLPRESDHGYWSEPFEFPTREQVIERLSEQETLYEPALYYQYSNLGLSLAGEVVAAVSGEPFDAYVRRSILEPLGLASTTPEMPEAERGGRLATGYSAITRAGTRVPAPFFLARGIAPAAGFASTVEDLARFASWQFRLLETRGDEVLNHNTLREMHRVHWVDRDLGSPRGLGFGVWRRGDKTFVGHGGSCPGFRTHLLLQTDDEIATVVMANAQGVATNEFAQSAYAIIAPAVREALGDSARATRAADGAANGLAEPAADAAAGSEAAVSDVARADSLERYAGNYASGFAGEIAVLPWQGSLALLGLPTMNPADNLTKLRAAGEHAFRRVRDDGELAEVIRFELGEDGRASVMIWNSNRYRRVR
ncbi:MAG: serine hydrolase domain-containing protein [Longimicrobiales bacterium]